MSSTNQGGCGCNQNAQASRVTDRPTLPLPDKSSTAASSGQDRPVATSAADVARLTRKATAVSATAAPRLRPPGAGDRAAIGAVGTNWSNCTRVSSLWSINQDRNSWVGIDSVGWQKLSYASDSGIVALTMLASHARQTGTCYVYRTEDDGMIHETYVW